MSQSGHAGRVIPAPNGVFLLVQDEAKLEIFVTPEIVLSEVIDH